MHYGWYKVGFERELREKLTPLTVGPKRLMLVRESGGFRAYDATCPHRGAHLAFGGKLEEGAIICPFHGRRIGLGCDSPMAYSVRAYRTVTAGGLVFVLLNEAHENGLTAFLEELEATHYFVQGFALQAKIPMAEIVVENGFDPSHFRAVHGLRTTPKLRLLPAVNGELQVETTFDAHAFDNVWHKDDDQATATEFRFLARIFSPNVCISHLGDGDGEHLVLSGATPNGDGTCVIRVSVAVPAGPNGKPPSEQAIRALLRDSRTAYEQDLVIWENRAYDAPQRLDAEDDLVVFFYKYCQRFTEAESHEPSFARQVR